MHNFAIVLPYSIISSRKSIRHGTAKLLKFATRFLHIAERSTVGSRLFDQQLTGLSH